jgi:hypothetical protein
MSVLQNILPYVSLINKKLDYVKTTSTEYVFELKGYKLPKNIIDKNSGKVLKERQAIILLDINQQSIGMHDYEVENYGDGIRFKLPISNFPTTYNLNETDNLQVTGTFSK